MVNAWLPPLVVKLFLLFYAFHPYCAETFVRRAVQHLQLIEQNLISQRLLMEQALRSRAL